MMALTQASATLLCGTSGMDCASIALCKLARIACKLCAHLITEAQASSFPPNGLRPLVFFLFDYCDTGPFSSAQILHLFMQSKLSLESKVGAREGAWSNLHRIMGQLRRMPLGSLDEANLPF